VPIVKFNAGDTILSEGDKGETAFLILKGSVEVAVGAEDKARVVGKLDAGEVFGEMSLIDAGPRSATIRAAGDTTCLETSFDGFLELVAENPKEAATILKTLVRRLRQMNELVARMDSENRSIREIARDWRGSIESGGVSDDERDRALVYLAESVPPEDPDEEDPDERERDIFSGWT
jgi:CRP/FNR family cyclic AMP-dependent transcriptional regulator